MRERTGAVKYSSIAWLINFLNLRFESKKRGEQKKVKEFLGESWPQDDIETAMNAQSKLVDLVTLAINGSTPEGLVMSLNEYVGHNSESWDPVRKNPPVRANWYARPLVDVMYRDYSQAILKMGKRQWIVQAAPLMFGTEGRVWLSIAQCLVNGEFGELRRCRLSECRLFFRTTDARQEFCCKDHQRKYDAEAAKARVRALRERQRVEKLGKKPTAKQPREVPALVTEPELFAQFLTLARGTVVQGSNVALLITKIPGKWNRVKKWFAESNDTAVIWSSLDTPTKNVFRKEWGIWVP